MDINGHAAAPAAAGGATHRSEPNMETPTPRPADFFPLEVVHLLGTARRVIDKHVDDCGCCADCGSSWPCQHAQLAEFTLATL